MTATQTTSGRPMIRIVTGITAAAACLAVAGTLGFSFLTARQDNTLTPAAQPNIQLEEQSTAPAETAAEPEPDERAFPLLAGMPEDKRTKTFEWGTVRLDSFRVYSFEENDKETQYINIAFDVHLNDDIDITKADDFSMEWNTFMYDTTMEHKIIQNNPTTAYLNDFVDSHNFKMNLCCYVPKEADTNCLTKDETGEYRAIYSDFLEKEPLPDYLLYELELCNASICIAHMDSGEDEVREVLLSEKTPMFKFRPADLPEDEDEPVEVKPGSTDAMIEEAYGAEAEITES